MLLESLLVQRCPKVGRCFQAGAPPSCDRTAASFALSHARAGSEEEPTILTWVLLCKSTRTSHIVGPELFVESGKRDTSYKLPVRADVVACGPRPGHGILVHCPVTACTD